MAAPKTFDFSSHAIRRALERGITKAEMISAITAPDSKRQQYRGAHGGFVYLFTKDINGRKLHVAAELYKDECF